MERYRPPIWWYCKVLTMLALVVWTFVALWRHLAPVWIRLPHDLGQVVVVLGAVSNLLHYRLLKRATPNLAAPRVLVRAGGLFRFVRHPMYLGDLLAIVGFMLWAGDVVAIGLAAAATLFLILLTRVEDRALAARFGSSHSAWRERTWHLLPWVW